MSDVIMLSQKFTEKDPLKLYEAVGNDEADKLVDRENTSPKTHQGKGAENPKMWWT